MKKVFIAAALAAMIVSCGSKGNKSAEIIAESELYFRCERQHTG